MNVTLNPSLNFTNQNFGSSKQILSNNITKLIPEKADTFINSVAPKKNTGLKRFIAIAAGVLCLSAGCENPYYTRTEVEYVAPKAPSVDYNDTQQELVLMNGVLNIPTAKDPGVVPPYAVQSFSYSDSDGNFVSDELISSTPYQSKFERTTLDSDLNVSRERILSSRQSDGSVRFDYLDRYKRPYAVLAIKNGRLEGYEVTSSQVNRIVIQNDMCGNLSEFVNGRFTKVIYSPKTILK